MGSPVVSRNLSTLFTSPLFAPGGAKGRSVDVSFASARGSLLMSLVVCLRRREGGGEEDKLKVEIKAWAVSTVRVVAVVQMFGILFCGWLWLAV
jgi:hypothetical protein